MENIDKLKQEFYTFLVQEGALFNFLQYRTIDSAFDYIIQHFSLSIFNLVWAIPDYNLSWKGTKEGYNYWATLDAKWKNHVDTHIIVEDENT